MDSLVSIIVPTYNRAKNIEDLLISCRESSFKDFEVIINDDNRTNDETPRIVSKFSDLLSIKYLRENVFVTQARNRGVEHAKGKYILHLDSDMKITEGLIRECVDLADRFDALVIPEEAYGTTFWAKCKWLEKRMYIGVEMIESARFIKRDSYLKLGGHNELLTFGEDKDLDLRVRESGLRIGRTKGFILHNEGDLSLWKSLVKRIYWTNAANLFKEIHPAEYKWQVNIFNRYALFLKNVKYLFSHPLIYVGLFYMKTCEFVFGGFGYFLRKYKV